jgi:hypothetical protein
MLQVKPIPPIILPQYSQSLQHGRLIQKIQLVFWRFTVISLLNGITQSVYAIETKAVRRSATAMPYSGNAERSK